MGRDGESVGGHKFCEKVVCKSREGNEDLRGRLGEMSPCLLRTFL